MKKTKVLKILIIAIIFVIIVGNVFNNVKAANIIDLYNGVDNTDLNDAENTTKKFINRTIGIVQAVGIFMAVAILSVLGMKFMIASPEEKAEIKKHLVVYTLGLLLLFTATGVLQIVKTFVINATA